MNRWYYFCAKIRERWPVRKRKDNDRGQRHRKKKNPTRLKKKKRSPSRFVSVGYAVFSAMTSSLNVKDLHRVWSVMKKHQDAHQTLMPYEALLSKFFPDFALVESSHVYILTHYNESTDCVEHCTLLFSDEEKLYFDRLLHDHRYVRLFLSPFKMDDGSPIITWLKESLAGYAKGYTKIKKALQNAQKNTEVHRVLRNMAEIDRRLSSVKASSTQRYLVCATPKHDDSDWDRSDPYKYKQGVSKTGSTFCHVAIIPMPAVQPKDIWDYIWKSSSSHYNDEEYLITKLKFLWFDTAFICDNDADMESAKALVARGVSEVLDGSLLDITNNENPESTFPLYQEDNVASIIVTNNSRKVPKWFDDIDLILNHVGEHGFSWEGAKHNELKILQRDTGFFFSHSDPIVRKRVEKIENGKEDLGPPLPKRTKMH